MSVIIDGEKYYSVKEASAIIGVHYITIYRWLDLRRISYFRPSERRTLIPEKEIKKYFNGEKNENFS